MSARRYTSSARCSHAGCGEVAHYEHDTAKDAREAGIRNQTWKCLRHAEPDKVLSPTNTERRTVLVATRVPYDGGGFLRGLFWIPEGATSGSGFTHGPGFRAYADDFAEGARIEVVARVIDAPLISDRHPAPVDDEETARAYAAGEFDLQMGAGAEERIERAGR